MFRLVSDFKPTGDQPTAIQQLTEGVSAGAKNQVLLGVTGSGKTYTMANVVKKLNMPALVISHNKTLAGQLYQEMRDFFPENAVSYFVSYYDYYQPEAYLPSTDTYIEKESEVNELIDKLRLQATANIMTRKDVVVVASVSCIYNIGSAEEYGRFTLQINRGDKADWNNLAKRLVELQYGRSEFDFKRGSFRVRGDYMDIYPAYEDFGYRVQSKGQFIESFTKFEPLSGKTIELQDQNETIIIYPAKHYLMDPDVFKPAEKVIRNDLKREYGLLKKDGKHLEAERLLRRVNYDLEMIKEVGYVNGIENYSRYFDGRKPGDPPYTLIDYFRIAYKNDFLVFVDESHMTVPQLRGMFNGDHARKRTLIDFGFRLQAAYDNRPLRFEEFYQIPPHLIYVSATPADWEIEKARTEAKEKKISHKGVVEQLIRPTGIIDPKITIRPSKTEVQDLIKETEVRVKKGEKILVTTLTKKMAEDLTDHLKERSIRASYLHSDVHTLERSDILDNLRKSEFDVLIGVNLLREGLDLPEVFLVAILDADKEGFLRSKTSLVQTMGRAARNISGEVIIYADVITGSIKSAINEIDRRRDHQRQYNKKHDIVPTTISKPIREKIVEHEVDPFYILNAHKPEISQEVVVDINPDALTGYDKKRMIKKLEREMRRQAEEMNFEFAISLRNKIRELRTDN